MSSIHGKNSLSFRRTKTGDVASSSATISQDSKFAHEASAGETFIDIDALVTPTSVNTGIINPTGSQLAALNLKSNKNSIIIISSSKGTLQEGSWSVSNSGRRINLNFSTAANEIFTVQVRTTQAVSNVVDAEPFTLTGTLTAGNTDIALGQAFTLNANSSTQIGEVLLYIDGVQQFRNVGNVTAAPAADGNYEEVDSGNGLTNLLRLNDSFGVDVSYAVVSTGLIVNTRDNDSWQQQIEALGGQLDAIIPTLADLAGVDETDFQAGPNNVDLKAFADKLYETCEGVESNDTDIASILNKNITQTFTNSFGETGNGGEIVGAGTATPFGSSNLKGWNGTQYTVQNSNSVIKLKFATRFTSSVGRGYSLYKNGSTYRFLSQTNTDTTHGGEYISFEGEFAAGDTISVRLFTGSGTLADLEEQHYINVVETWKETSKISDL